MNTTLCSRIDFAKIVEYNSIYFFRHEVVSENEDNLMVKEVMAVVPHATYETLVAGLIHTKYSTDAETAILANYLADPSNEAHKAEFDEYQAWRTEVKTACKEYYNID